MTYTVAPPALLTAGFSVVPAPRIGNTIIGDDTIKPPGARSGVHARPERRKSAFGHHAAHTARQAWYGSSCLRSLRHRERESRPDTRAQQCSRNELPIHISVWSTNRTVSRSPGLPPLLPRRLFTRVRSGGRTRRKLCGKARPYQVSRSLDDSCGQHVRTTPTITLCDGLPPTLVDTAGNLTPAAGDPRDARVRRLAGGTFPHEECAPVQSLRCAGGSCAQARGRLCANRAIVDTLIFL